MNTILLIASAVLIILSLVLKNWYLGACSLACLILSFFLGGVPRLFMAAVLALSLVGCAGSGEGGAWTPADTSAALGTANQAYGLYDRYQNPAAYRSNGQMYYAPALVP